MTPQEIRQTREVLGLTQEAAGELLGVGASAFHKYETGKTRPGKAVCELLARIRRERRRVPEPFRLRVDDTKRLNGRELEELLHRLLEEVSLAAGSIAPRPDHNAADGGLDAEVSWQGEPEPDWTEILPARHVGFQAKACSMSPENCYQEMLKDGRIKPEILRILMQGGHYVIVCSRQQLGRTAIERRRERMRDAVQDAVQDAHPQFGKDVIERLDFWDANKVADLVNRRICVCEFVRRRLGLQSAGPFVSLEYLANEKEHCSKYFPDHARETLARKLSKLLAAPNAIVRVTGSAGIGKTRFVIEALRSDRLSSTMYADAARPSNLRDLVQAGHSGLIIVDNCAAGRARELIRPAVHSDSSLKMIVIDDEPGEETSGIPRIELKGADDRLIKGILRSTMPGQASLNIAGCIRAAAGFPKMARLIAQDSWRNPSAIVDSSACYRMLGGAAEGADDLQRTARLLAVFTSVGFEEDSAAEFECLTRLDENGMRAGQLRENIEKLKRRGLLRTTAGRIGLTPLPLAWLLAKEQWELWPEDKFAGIVWGDSLAENMQKRMLMRLQELELEPKHDLKFVRQGERLLSKISSKEDFDRLLDSDNLLILLGQLVPVQLAKKLNSAANFCLAHHARALPDTLVAISRKNPKAFVPAAGLLFELAAAGAEPDTRQQAEYEINDLFASPVEFPDDLAGEKMRLLGDLQEKANTRAREDLLLHALTRPFADCRNDVSALREVRNRKNGGAALRQKCLRQLVALCISQQTDLAGRARKAFTGHIRAMLALLPFAKVAEAITEVATHTGGYFPEAVAQIGQAMCYDWHSDSEMTDRLAQLCATLGPRNLHEQIDFVVSRCVNHHLCMHKADSGNADESVEQLADYENRAWQMREEKVRQLAGQLAPAWRRHWKTFADLATSEHREAHEEFGRHLYRFAAEREEMAWRALEATEKAAIDGKTSFAFLRGIVRAAAADNPALVDELLARIAANDAMSSALVFFCRAAGLSEKRLALLADCIARNIARNPEQDNFLEWLTGSDISEEQAAAFAASLLASSQDHLHPVVYNCTRFLYYFVLKKGVRLEKLAPVFHELLAKPTPEFWNTCKLSHELAELTMRFLPGKSGLVGRITDRTAEIAAQALIKAMEKEFPKHNCRKFFYPVMQKALAECPEIAWPPLGERIVAASGSSSFISKMKYFFSSRSLLRRLPEEMLLAWCDRDRKAQSFALSVLPVLKMDGPGIVCDIDELTLKLICRYEDNAEIYNSLTLREATFETIDSRQKFANSLEKLTATRTDLPWKLEDWLKKECESRKMNIQSDREDDLY